MTEHTRTISVLTNTPDSVAAYLYGHTEEVSRTPEGEHSTRIILVTTADTASSAEFLANYQADRLCSGLHGARVLPVGVTE